MTLPWREWPLLRPRIAIPRWIISLHKHTENIPLIHVGVRTILFQQVMRAYQITTGFLEARSGELHRHMHEWMEEHKELESAIEVVNGESLQDVRDAWVEIEHFRQSYPQLTAAIMAQQAAELMLHKREKLIDEFEAAGDITEEEAEHLREHNNKCSKQLHRNIFQELPPEQDVLRDLLRGTFKAWPSMKDWTDEEFDTLFGANLTESVFEPGKAVTVAGLLVVSGGKGVMQTNQKNRIHEVKRGDVVGAVDAIARRQIRTVVTPMGGELRAFAISSADARRLKDNRSFEYALWRIAGMEVARIHFSNEFRMYSAEQLRGLFNAAFVWHSEGGLVVDLAQQRVDRALLLTGRVRVGDTELPQPGQDFALIDGGRVVEPLGPCGLIMFKEEDAAAAGRTRTEVEENLGNVSRMRTVANSIKPRRISDADEGSMPEGFNISRTRSSISRHVQGHPEGRGMSMERGRSVDASARRAPVGQGRRSFSPSTRSRRAPADLEMATLKGGHSLIPPAMDRGASDTDLVPHRREEMLSPVAVGGFEADQHEGSFDEHHIESGGAFGPSAADDHEQHVERGGGLAPISLGDLEHHGDDTM
mmetsp:Transcript_17197/g.37279  ORF Transcript_17197/g.37279 Transcript_17197/m.37279 type:complete len:591 (-) Transcript_17197:20-1792(-)